MNPVNFNKMPIGQATDMNISRRHFLFLAGAAAAVTLGACSAGSIADPESVANGSSQSAENTHMKTLPEFDTSQESRLLEGTWSYMVGASKEDNGLRVRATGSAVRTHPETWSDPEYAEYQPNPPVNSYGTYVQFSGGSEIGFSLRLTDIEGAASVSFHAAPPVRYDESVHRRPGIDIQLDGDRVSISVFDGKDMKPETENQFNFESIGNHTDIVFGHYDGQMVIGVNDETYTIDGEVFDDQVWFGMDTRGGYLLEEFSAYPVGSTRMHTVDASKAVYAGGNSSPIGLAGLAAANGRGDTLMGVAADLNVIASNRQYAEFIFANFNSFEPEMLAKPQALQPNKGQWEWGELDAFVDIVTRHGGEVRGHTLVFGEANPKWLEDALQNADRYEAEQLLRSVVQTPIIRYNGENGHGMIRRWDVVNEPGGDGERYGYGEINRDNIWFKALGRDYVRLAFQYAREANPDGYYTLNEYGADTDDDRLTFDLELVRWINEREHLVDEIGIQSHVFEETVDDTDVLSELRNGRLEYVARRFAEEGIRSRISELSVASGSSEGQENPALQSEIFGIYYRAGIRSEHISEVNLWGATNSHAGYFYFTGDYMRGDPGDDAPTTQDKSGIIREKPAMLAIRAALSGR